MADADETIKDASEGGIGAGLATAPQKREHIRRWVEIYSWATTAVTLETLGITALIQNVSVRCHRLVHVSSSHRGIRMLEKNGPRSGSEGARPGRVIVSRLGATPIPEPERR